MRSLFGSFRQAVTPIFMLHRFADRELGIPGHDVSTVRRHLAWLRRHKYRILAINELVRELVDDPRALRRTVCLTVDDGYEDFARLGWPVFAEFDCPVTVFLTTGFIDGTMWFWWDQLEYAFSRSNRSECAVVLSDRTERLAWGDPRSRTATLFGLVELLKRVPDEDRMSALEQIREQLVIDIPEAPPPEYAPLTWEQVRRLAPQGASFGPHTVTHPILSRTNDERSAMEIRASWDRIQAETSGAVPVFCYPNGTSADFTAREIETVRQARLDAALATQPGYASAKEVTASHSSARYALPRFAFPEQHDHFVQIVSGIERAKILLRGGA
jgi:peptidoglycan/xylan/chitin deacetylase (PgdA/CDA1 family)